MFTRHKTTQHAPIRVATLSCCLALLLSPIPVTAEDTLTVGVFPRRSAAITVRFFTPLTEYLGKKLGRRVELSTTPDFASFWSKVASQEYHLVHYNQYHYLRSHKLFGYRVILRNEEFGRANIGAALVVRKDSGIDRVADLKNQKIVFGGGRMAMISYIVATDLLRKGGLGADDYLTQFALTPPKACIATYYRQASAAGAGDGILQLPGLVKTIDTEEMKLIAVSRPLAHLPWAVNHKVPEKLATQIQMILSNMIHTEEGNRILKGAGLTNLVTTSDPDYNPHREIVKRVLGEEL